MLVYKHYFQHLNQSLTLKPLEEAFCHSVPEIHHSDQGVQYLSKAYIATLQAQGVEISVAERGRPWENGYAERLIRTLKEEEVHLNDYQNITEARERIGHFITQVYHDYMPSDQHRSCTNIAYTQTLLLCNHTLYVGVTCIQTLLSRKQDII